jgi:hypothetical protein
VTETEISYEHEPGLSISNHIAKLWLNPDQLETYTHSCLIGEVLGNEIDWDHEPELQVQNALDTFNQLQIDDLQQREILYTLISNMPLDSEAMILLNISIHEYIEKLASICDYEECAGEVSFK